MHYKAHLFTLVLSLTSYNRSLLHLHLNLHLRESKPTASSPQMVRHISRTTIKPSPLPESVDDHHFHLTPWGLKWLSANYIQYGLLFAEAGGDQVVDRLKSSLFAALRHFYPLAGRLKTQNEDGGMFVSLDVNGGELGVEFVQAVANNVTVADVAEDEVLPFTRSFFTLNGAVGYDAHSLPPFAAQVTELADGIFLGFSFNHAIGDGVCCMNFLTAWAEICRQGAGKDGRECTMAIERPPHLGSWLIDDVSPPIKLPFSHPDEFIDRITPPPELRERMFHLSAHSMTQLKLRANDECNTNGEVSGLQALCSLVWRSVTRARRLQPEIKTTCHVAANNRPRLCPPLPGDYFGTAAELVDVTTTAGDLQGHGLGWGAMLVHRSIVAHTDGAIRGALRAWVEKPSITQPSAFNQHDLTIGSSPRFDLYGCDFGWGKAVAVRSGIASKYDGKVAMYMGREGRGSVDMEINLKSEAMAALESDEEFMSVVSP